MTYKVQSTEKNNSTANEYETKALLYLMSFCQDSTNIEYFVIDFFNDVSGADSYVQNIWDIQSKASKTNSAKNIGEALVTLFKNYNQTDFLPFKKFILFVGGVSKNLLKNNSLIEFGLDNIADSQLPKLISSFKDCCGDKTYIDDQWINDNNIRAFLNSVVIHISLLTQKEYVMGVINSSTIKIPNDFVLEKIFNEIRDKQTCKKNISVENIILRRPDDFLRYNKHLRKKDILLLLLNRVINADIMNTSIPPMFMNVYNSLPEIDRSEKLEECRHAMALTLYDKNNSNNIWALYENIYDLLIKYPQYDIIKIYDLVNKNLARKVNTLEVVSLKYLIAVINGGIRQ